MDDCGRWIEDRDEVGSEALAGVRKKIGVEVEFLRG